MAYVNDTTDRSSEGNVSNHRKSYVTCNSVVQWYFSIAQKICHALISMLQAYQQKQLISINPFSVCGLL